MNSPPPQDEERVLIVAPTARDARLSEALFAQAGLPCAVCQDLATFAEELARGAGAVVLTEEALALRHSRLLTAALAAQPTWSSLPIILLAGGGPRRLLSAPLVRQLGNVTILERPISTQTLLSVVEMALRARRRQYQARLVSEAGRLLTGSLCDETTLAAVVALLVPHLADCCLLYVLGGARPCAPVAAFTPEAAHAEARLRDVGGCSALEPAAAAQPPEEPAGSASAVGLAQRHLEIVGAVARQIVPLEVQGRPLGALGLGMLTPERAFTDDDLQVVQEVAGRLSLALDQARLYQAEHAARAEAEAAVRSRDELMALISHDLNNPLTVILGQAQLLEHRLDNGSIGVQQVLKKLAGVRRAARQMQAQIAELLDAARLGAGQPIDMLREATDLVALTRSAAATVQQGTEQHQLEVQTRLSALIARVDPVRLERVLDNLLTNAVKYSPAGGVITITIDVEDEGGAAWAVVRVRDQGIGIPSADLPHVFERFRRASNVTPAISGTGLGLASARQIVEQHGGRLTAESPQGGGALFIVRLPLALAESG